MWTRLIIHMTWWTAPLRSCLGHVFGSLHQGQQCLTIASTATTSILSFLSQDSLTADVSNSETLIEHYWTQPLLPQLLNRIWQYYTWMNINTSHDLPARFLKTPCRTSAKLSNFSSPFPTQILLELRVLTMSKMEQTFERQQEKFLSSEQFFGSSTNHRLSNPMNTLVIPEAMIW